MQSWEIQQLNRTHDRSVFDCGQPMLNEWLKIRAGQFDRKDLAKIFVATQSGSSVVGGYYAISNHHIAKELLPPDHAKGLPKIEIPAVLLGRLAVDRSVQGKGLGLLLLTDALRRISDMSEQVGIRAVEVDAIDEAARQFYCKFGFRKLLDDPSHLFMPIHEVRKLKLDSSP